MNYVPKSFLALLTLVTMAASLLAQGTAKPSASVTPKAAATPTQAPTPTALRLGSNLCFFLHMRRLIN
jgi:hypothetical protein